MIHLTESIIAVRVPVEAYLIEVEKDKIYYELPENIIEKCIILGFDAELLGVIGAGEEIPEELAKIVMEMEGAEKIKVGIMEQTTTPSQALINLLEYQGIDLTKEKVIIIKVGS